MSSKYTGLKVKELKDLCQKRELSTDGKKEELIDTLMKDDEMKEIEQLEKEFHFSEMDDTKVTLDLAEEEILKPISFDSQIISESVLSDDENDLLDNVPEKPIAPPKKEEPAAPKKFQFTPIVFDAKKANPQPESKKKITVIEVEEEEKKLISKKVVQKKKSVEKVTVTSEKKNVEAEKLKVEAEKRLERMKRFGITVNEESMKELRAARFGMLDTSNEGVKKKSQKQQQQAVKKPQPQQEKKLTKEEELLKKRAERFGLPDKKTQIPAAVDKGKGKKKENTQHDNSKPGGQKSNNRNGQNSNNKADNRHNKNTGKRFQTTSKAQNNNNNNKRQQIVSKNNKQIGQSTRSIINNVRNGRVVKKEAIITNTKAAILSRKNANIKRMNAIVQQANGSNANNRRVTKTNNTQIMETRSVVITSNSNRIQQPTRQITIATNTNNTRKRKQQNQRQIININNTSNKKRRH